MRDEERFLSDLGGGGNEDGKGMRIEKVNVVDEVDDLWNIDQEVAMNSSCVNPNWKYW